MESGEALHAAVKRGDLKTIRDLLAANHSPNTLDTAGLPPLAYVLDHVDYHGFILSEQISEMIRLLGAAGAYPLSESAKHRVMDEAWRSVTSALEANDARRLDALLDSVGDHPSAPVSEVREGDGPVDAPSPPDTHTAVPEGIATSRQPGVVMMPMTRGRRIFVGAALSFGALLLLLLAFRTVQALIEGRESSDPLVLGIVLTCYGLAWWLIRSSGRKTLIQLERIGRETGLTAIVYTGFGLVNRPSLQGSTRRGRIHAASSPAASGGNPFTRIEIAEPDDPDALSAWVAGDVSKHRLNCLGAYRAPGNVYRIDISGVIGQPHVADFIIRLAGHMNG